MILEILLSTGRGVRGEFSSRSGELLLHKTSIVENRACGDEAFLGSARVVLHVC
jgi:hypothetical protein